jgi:hypothetical protein
MPITRLHPMIFLAICMAAEPVALRSVSVGRHLYDTLENLPRGTTDDDCVLGLGLAHVV